MSIGTNEAPIVGSVLFEGNRTYGSGGAIYNTVYKTLPDGDLTTFGNLSFIGNKAGASGGAIYNMARVTINALNGNVLFDSNIAGYKKDKPTSYTDNSFGGAIRNGGALTLLSSSDGSIAFRNNQAYTGGAISNVKAMTLNGNFEFSGNKSYRGGGAIYNEGDLSLIGTYTFSDNKTVTSRVNDYNGGGAILNVGGDLNVLGIRKEDGSTSINFINNAVRNGLGATFNSLHGTGGAITILGAASNKSGTAWISGVDFIGNSSKRGGAARCGENPAESTNYAAELWINDSKFINNYAGSYGGAIGSGGKGDVLVSNSTFLGNWLRDKDAADAGAISSGHKLQIVNTTFKDNLAGSAGGAVAFNGHTMSIIADAADTVFTNNGLVNKAALPFNTIEDAMKNKSSDYGITLRNNGNSPSRPRAYFNAGNGGSIIIDDAINTYEGGPLELYINSDTITENHKDNKTLPDILVSRNTYSYYVPNLDNIDNEEKVKTEKVLPLPTNGSVILNNKITDFNIHVHDGLLEIGKNPGIAKDKNSSVYKSGNQYFSNSRLFMEGGTISFANGNIEGNNLIAPASFEVKKDSFLRFDVDLSNQKVDYINQAINAYGGTLCIDRILFTGDLPVAIGETRNFRFAATNKGTPITLLNSLSTVITSQAGYSLDLITSGTNAQGNNTLAVKKVIDAGGLPVAVTIGKYFDVSTYVYSATEDEKLDNWGVKFHVSKDSVTTEETATNVLQGTKLVINGNGRNIIHTDSTSLDGIVVNNGQTLEIKDIYGIDAATKEKIGWKGFNSAIINNGGTVKVSNSIFTNNNASVTPAKADGSGGNPDGVGGAIRNIGGTIDLINTSFIKNTAANHGGAIYNKNGIVNIIAYNSSKVDFTENSDAIYNVDGTVNLSADINSSIIFNDPIIGSDRNNSHINITDDNAGSVVFNNAISNSLVQFNQGTLKLDKNGSISNSNFTINGGNLDLQNGNIDILKLDNLSINNDFNLLLDFDVSKDKDNVDKIVLGGSILGSGGTVNIDRLNIIGKMDKDTTSITAEFIDQSVKSSISEVAKSITIDNVAYSITVNNNVLCIIKDSDSSGFPWVVAYSDDLIRYYDIDDKEDTTFKWINGNNKLKGVELRIRGKNNGHAIDGINSDDTYKDGIIVGKRQGSEQTLDISDVSSYKHFNSAVINKGGSVKIAKSTFEDNSGYVDTEHDKTQTLSSGGAIYNYSGIVDISGGSSEKPTIFQNNSADLYGGAIYNNAELNIVTSRASNVRFINNIANGKPNDIYQTENGVTNITGSLNSILRLYGGFAGKGEINKLGESLLDLLGDNSEYTGVFNADSYSPEGKDIEKGIVTINYGENSKFFGGQSNIKNTVLNWYTNNDISPDAELNLDETASLVVGNGTNEAQLTIIDKKSSIDNIESLKINNQGKLILGTDTKLKIAVTGSGTLALNSQKELTLQDGVTIPDSLIFNTNGGKVTVDEISNIASVDSLLGAILGDNDSYSNLTLKLNNSSTSKNIDGTKVSNLLISGNVTTSGAISGSGEITKVDNGTYTVNGKVSDFNGIFTQEVGVTEITAVDGKIFGGDKIIKSGTLNILSDAALNYNNIQLFEKTEFNHTAATAVLNTIESDVLSFKGADAVATFSNGNYKLASDISNNQKNTVKFSNSNLALGTDTFGSNTIYSLENSVLNLQDGVIKNYTFNNLLSDENSSVDIDIKFSDETSKDRYLMTDTLEVTQNSPSINLGLVKLVGNENESGQSVYTTITNVLTGATFANDKDQFMVTTGAFEYNGSIINKNTIQLVRNKIANENSLNSVNKLNGLRYFQFSTGDNKTYNIGSSLSPMGNGTFYVTGNLEDGKLVNTISGNLVDDKGQLTGDSGKLFNIAADTEVNFTIKDLIIADTKGENGSVLSNESDKAVVLIEDTKLSNNIATKNGGAIYSAAGSVTLASTELTGNTAANGGAIYNTDGNVSLSSSGLTGNTATGDGGAVYNTAGTVTVENTELTDNTASNGGAIYNTSGKLSLNNAKLTGNTVKSHGGAIYNESATPMIITGGELTGNTSGGLGGAIYTEGDLILKNVNFSLNNDSNGSNDIYLAKKSVATVITEVDSEIRSGIAGSGTLNKTGSGKLTLSGNNKNFSGDLNILQGEMVYNQATENDSYISGTTNVNANSLVINNNLSNITAGKFTGTGVVTKSGEKQLTMIGDNSEFSGTLNITEGTVKVNTDTSKYISGKTDMTSGSTLSLEGNKDVSLSQISGKGTLAKAGNGKLTIVGNNSDYTGNLNVVCGTFAMATGSTIGTLGNGIFNGETSINLQNTQAIKDASGNWATNPNPASIENLKFDTLALNGNVNLLLDVDLKNTIADTISANQLKGTGHLILNSNGLNVVSDALLDNTSVRIANGAVATGNAILLSDNAKEVMGPIQKYDVTYGNGLLEFSRQGGVTPTPQQVNMGIMASPVATQIGGFLTQSQTLQDGFFHMDRYSKYSRSARFAAENPNTYAIKDIATIYNNADIPMTSQSMWIKPYTTFETVNLKGGIGVSNVAYGALYGGDSEMVDLGHGVKGVVSAFVGYTGAHQSYNGISMDQQGGTLGFTGTVYKGNFFSGLTVSAGASAGEAYVSGGTDHFSMITAGIANKTGYNIEFKEGKLVVQPSLFLGYTFVNTFDYTNVDGVRVNSDSLNAIQVAPGVKVIGNLKNGWQPYAGVDVVWNIMGKTNVQANDVKLPELSVKPYVQYGAGVQKSWGEHFTAFFQTMFRNGGRNGLILSGGFRWTIGKDNSKKSPKGEEKVVPVKVLKQLKK